MLVIRSSPGALFFGSLDSISATKLGEVCKVELGAAFVNLRMKFVTSGSSGPGFSVNCWARESAISSALSVAEKTRPFGPDSGWVAGRLCNKVLFILYIEPS